MYQQCKCISFLYLVVREVPVHLVVLVNLVKNVYTITK